MLDKYEYRIPWWAVLVKGDVANVSPLLGPALRMLDHPPDTGDLDIGPGDGWTVIVSYRREEPNYELADALRALAETEVIVLEWGYAPWVHRWNEAEKRWFFAEQGVSALGAQLKIEWPWPPMPDKTRGRPRRFAALVEGPPLADVAQRAREASNVFETPRGAVVLGEKTARMDYDEVPGVTVYDVMHLLDIHKLVVTIVREGNVRVFGRDPNYGTPIAEVDGETEPRAILRKLGIPEDYMFPPDTN